MVGGSIAALTAAGGLRQEGFDGELTLVSAEPHPPYSRVPLSKGVLAGTEAAETTLLPTAGLDLALRTGVVATALDTGRRLVSLADGDRLPYDGLVVATGARARRLPGAEGAAVVRTLDDALALHARLRSAGSVVVVGASFLGMEIASTARALGLAVTVVDLAPPLGRLGRWLSALAGAVAREAGIRVIHSSAGVRCTGPHTVSCSGDVVQADLVVCAVGDEPDVGWLQGSGLPVDHATRGVPVDERCRVTPSIVAAGDVTTRLGRRTPHWTNAVEQGRAAAAALLRGDEAAPCRHDPYFWTEQTGFTVKISGELPPDTDPEILDGDPGGSERSLLLRWQYEGGSTVAAVNYRIPVVRLKRLGAGAPAVSPTS